MQPLAVARSSTDPEEVVEILDPVWPGVTIRPRRKEFRFDASLARLEAVGMFRVHCDSITVTQGPRAWTSLVLPVDGPLDLMRDGHYRGHSPGSALVLSPDEPFGLRAHDNTGVNYAITLAQAFVDQTARRLGLAAVSGGRQLAFDVRSPVGASLLRYVRFLWQETTHVGLLQRSAVARTEMEGALVSALLIACLGSPERRAQGAATSALRDVEDYIDAHLSEPLALADLAAVAGVRAETLIRNFKRRHGVTPMRFVRQRRLEEINRLLRDGEPRSLRVTDVALQFGFTQLGRFAGTYRAAFGETPSQTLRRT